MKLINFLSYDSGRCPYHCLQVTTTIFHDGFPQCHVIVILSDTTHHFVQRCQLTGRPFGAIVPQAVKYLFQALTTKYGIDLVDVRFQCERLVKIQTALT